VKKNFKKILMIFLLAEIFCLSLGAENLTMQKVSAELSRHKVSRGNFVQTKKISSIGRTLKSSGKFVFCSDGIVWKTQRPFPSTLALGGGVMIQISADGKKSVTDMGANETFKNISASLQAVFSGDMNSLEENFEIFFAEKSGGVWNAKLLPKDKNFSAAVSEIFIEGIFSSAECVMNSVSVEEKSGDRILYEFSETQYAQELSADEKSIFAR
jgi:hypothetical protein